MKIGILGSGNMGRSIGMRWAENGHEVFFGSRSGEKGRETAAFVGHESRGGTNDEAAAFGEVLLHTAREIMPSEMLTSIEQLAGKIIIDCNNGVIPEGFAYEAITKSHAEKVAEDVPQAFVVKALNTMAQEVFEHSPDTLREYKTAAFISGDDEKAKETVNRLVSELGFTAIDSGNLRNSRLIETLGDLTRYLIIGAKRGVMMSLSVGALPTVENTRLGGRQPSKLD